MAQAAALQGLVKAHMGQIILKGGAQARIQIVREHEYVVRVHARWRPRLPPAALVAQVADRPQAAGNGTGTWALRC